MQTRKLGAMAEPGTQQATRTSIDRSEAVRTDAHNWFAEHWSNDLALGEWWRLLAESGWGFPTWPVGRFGRGLPSHTASVVADVRHRSETDKAAPAP